MKGEIPVAYIVAIILAVIVIGLIGYWLIVNVGIFGGASSEKVCQATLMEKCVGKPGDTAIDQYKYNECKGTDTAKKVTKCSDVF